MSRRRIDTDDEIQCLHCSCRIRHGFKAVARSVICIVVFGELRGCRPKPEENKESIFGIVARGLNS